jgi:hypothetical protein
MCVTPFELLALAHMRIAAARENNRSDVGLAPIHGLVAPDDGAASVGHSTGWPDARP